MITIVIAIILTFVTRRITMITTEVAIVVIMIVGLTRSLKGSESKVIGWELGNLGSTQQDLGSLWDDYVGIGV